MSTSGRGTLVIGLGNTDRGDDAVGLVVAERLAARDPDVDVLAWTGADVDLLDVWAGHDRVVVVDAVRSEDPPGTRRRRLIGSGTREQWSRSARPGGSHALGLAGVVVLGQRLGRLPATLEIVTVEVAETTVGTTLTPTVAAAADRVVADLAVEFGRPITPTTPASTAVGR